MSAQYLKQAKDRSFHIHSVSQSVQLHVTIVRQTDSNHSIIPSFEAIQSVTDRFVTVIEKNIHIFQATLSLENKDEITHAEAPFPCQSRNIKYVVHHVGLTDTFLNSKVPRKVCWNSKRKPREQF